jgi:hypothetical protein
MPKLGYGYALYPGSPSSLPSDISGLSLWLKADAGVSTIQENFVSQIVISGSTLPESNGTFIRTSPGGYLYNTLNQDGFIFFNSGNWYINDYNTQNVTYVNYGSSLNENGWVPDQEYYGPVIAKNTITKDPLFRVNSWADQSGNGNNATSVVNPVYTASAKNGKPAITFSGTELMTTENIFNGSNPRTMFAVYYIDNNITSNTICGQTNDDGLASGSFFLLQARHDFTNPYLATSNDDLSGIDFTNQVWKISMADYDGTTGNLYSNGTNVGTNTFSWDTYNGTFCIGAYFTNESIESLQELLVGKVAEMIVYNRVLTTPERQQVEGYLNAKYAIY